MKKNHHSKYGNCFCYFLCFLSVFLVVLAGCNRPLPEQEAKKYLRAFDNELIHFVGKIGETKAYRAMWKLFSLKNAPLPYIFSTSKSKNENCGQFEFNKVKGVYRYDEICGSFVRTESCDSIVIDFPFRSEHDTMARFVITDYSEGLTLLQMMYPTRFNAYLKIGNRVMLSVHHDGSISHGVPVSGELKIGLPGFSIQTRLQTKLFRSYGMLKLDLSLWEDSKEIMTWITQSKVTFAADNTLVYNNVKMDLKMYPVRVKMSIDYQSINPRTTDFVDDFNQNSEIALFTLSHNRLIGNVKLIDRVQSDKLNVAVVYDDKSYELLEGFLLSASKILNIKI